jgi:hypothetical protein
MNQLDHHAWKPLAASPPWARTTSVLLDVPRSRATARSKVSRAQLALSRIFDRSAQRAREFAPPPENIYEELGVSPCRR